MTRSAMAQPDPEQGPGGSNSHRASRPRRRVRRALRVMTLVGSVALLCIVIVAALAWRAVHERNEAVPSDVRRALLAPDDSAGSSARVVLLVGADTSKVRQRQLPSGTATADSLMLLRIDPGRESISLLSIPRDLLVTLPDHGPDKVGAAYGIGGLALAVRTVQTELDIDIHHVVLVDFDGFRDVIDSLGGISIDNPHAIRSAVPFDGRSWEFRQGEMRLNGRSALAYARIRKVDGRSIAINADEAEELGRSFRQQRVIDATLEKLTLRRVLVNPISLPADVLRPVTTDIGVTTLAHWGMSGIANRAGSGLRCRLGGSIVPREGDQVLVPAPQNAAVVSAFLGAGEVPPPISPLDGGCWRLEP